MGSSRRRSVRRACFVAAALCLAGSVAGPSAAQEDEDAIPRPEVFRGGATALVASVEVDREALLPVPDIFRFVVLDGASIYESSVRQARASIFFPGNGLILGPNLACGTFGNAFPPEFKPVLDLCLQYQYPLTVFADEFRPDGATTGSLALGAPTDPVSGTAVRAVAHAGEDSATTDAAITDLRVLGLPAFGPVLPLVPDLILDTAVLTIDGATSRTNQRIERGVLIVDAEATLDGVRLLGGLVRIGAVRSESHVTDDAKGTRTARSELEVSGVTVAGIPAQITEDGLILGSPTGGLGPIVQQIQVQVNELLRTLGISIRTLGGVETLDDNGSAVASAEGLLISIAQGVDGLPTVPGPLGDIDPNGIYEASVQLGSTAARGAAFAIDPDAPPDEGGTGSIDGGFSSPDGFSVPSGDGSLGAPDLPAPTSPAGPETALGERSSIADLFDDRLGLLYLALAFAALGLCIVPRLAVPARLPGPRS